MIHGLKTNIRAVERADARFVADLLNQSSVQTGWGTTGVPISVHRVEQDIEQWLEEERTSARPAALIIDALGHGPVGLVIVLIPDRFHPSTTAISVAIEAESQDQGYGRDALTALIDALFDDWRMHRIEATCESGNDRAAGLYESLGFIREGTRRRVSFTGGQFLDQHIYGLLSTDARPELS